jgi:hypothetical protein
VLFSLLLACSPNHDLLLSSAAPGVDALFEVRRRVGETAIRLSLRAERIEVRGA